MTLQHVKSFDAMPEPPDIFQPHMPGVELLSDMDAYFAAARKLSATGKSQAGTEEPPVEVAAELEQMKGRRAAVIVTPGRLMMSVPAPELASLPKDMVESARQMLSPDPPKVVSVISYTYVPALIEDERKAIPFLGFLVGFAAIGHTVVVFEGHPSAFESGVRGSDVLLVDSGMVPFIQKDWKEVAFRVMRPGAKVLEHDRATYQLKHHFAPGAAQALLRLSPEKQVDWYAGTLIRLLFVGTRTSAQLTSGETLPDLAEFAQTDELRAQLAALPVRHTELDADKVIDLIVKQAGLGFFSKTGLVKVPIETAEGLRQVACGVELAKGPGGKRRLLLER
ncbi:MAG: hypothetical protein ACJ74T_21885 [Pyrinomonadaceae bacterium]